MTLVVTICTFQNTMAKLKYVNTYNNNLYILLFILCVSLLCVSCRILPKMCRILKKNWPATYVSFKNGGAGERADSPVVGSGWWLPAREPSSPSYAFVSRRGMSPKIKKSVASHTWSHKEIVTRPSFTKPWSSGDLQKDAVLYLCV